jgi:CubicO group peptidase (beta-lactamase class C family)
MLVMRGCDLGNGRVDIFNGFIFMIFFIVIFCLNKNLSTSYMKNLIRFSAILLLCLPVFTFSSFAQVIDRSNTRHPSVDYAKLARIDELVNDYIRKDWERGLVTIIIKDNKLIQYKGYGFANAEKTKPMPNDAIFRIMSQSKAITTTGIMILYEQGKLLLDEPIGNYIPEFKRQVVLDKFNDKDTTYTTVPARRNITFRDLLTHTSGIGYPAIGSQNMKAIYAKAKIPSGLGYFNATLLDEMKKLAKLPLAFQPGEKWQYGLNSDLLGCLIEVISGQSLDVFLRRNIFEPLGMKDTYFNVPAAKFDRMATVYTEDSAGHMITWSHSFRDIDPDYPSMNTHYFSGGAGLSSTAFDYAIFFQMLLNKGIYNGKRILSPRSVETMTSNQLNFKYNGTNDYGLGLDIVSEITGNQGPRNKGTFSWGGYFGTTSWADPKANLVVLIMAQHTPNSHGDLVAKITSVIYSSLTK